MNFKNHVKDRIGYALIFFVNTLLIILTMNLTLIISERRIPKENIFYAFLISSALFLLYIIYDYIRMKPFYNYLNKAADSDGGLDSMLSIAEARTQEQSLYNKIMYESYKSYTGKLSKYEENQKQYIYFINQWVHQMKTPVSVINLLLQDENFNTEPTRPKPPATISSGYQRAVKSSMDSTNIQWGLNPPLNEVSFNETLESISEENEKINHGLEMMLCNARLSQFNLDFKVEKVDILSAIRAVINDNKKALIRHSIYPRIVCKEAMKVETDSKWISFVINQILINAIKYSKDISSEKKYITFEVKDERSRLILSIEDQGIGIPKEDRSRVFNAFFTGKNGRKTAESTGMGMYLSKRICDELGHGLSAESEEGLGTKFFIAFYKGKTIFNLSKL